MQDLFNRILLILAEGEQIPLRNGNFYRFIGPTATRINGQEFPLAFEYEISEQNHKKVTTALINEMYIRHQQIGMMPSKTEMLPIFLYELSGRPCNYTVASYIIQKLIRNDNHNKS